LAFAHHYFNKAMRVQSVVVVDGQHSMMSFTFVVFEEEIMLYERNGFAVKIERNHGDAWTMKTMLQRVQAANSGQPPWCSGIHMAFYWLIAHFHEPLPNLVTVQAILEAHQRGQQPVVPTLEALRTVDPLVYLDQGTVCLRIEHWTVQENEYWLFYCRGGGEALAWKVPYERIFKLWTQPMGHVNSIPEMRSWLAEEHGDVAL
jgi:hypothetical protein